MRVFISRLISAVGGRRRDADLRDDIQAHLDALIEEHVRGGMSLRDAIAAARRDFGGVEQIKETYRDQRGVPLIETFVRDVRHAARNLRRSPVFTAVTMLTFALGIGATTSVFAIVQGVLLRPLPYPNAARLVQIVQTLPRAGSAESRSQPPSVVNALSPNQFLELRARSRTLSHVAAFTTTSMTLTGLGDAVRVNVGRVTAGFFEAFGIRPVLGRTFLPDDEPVPGSAGLSAALTYRAWTRWFGRDPNIVGKTVVLNDFAYRIVGVMPEGFNVPEPGAATITRTESGELENALDVWLPWALLPGPGSDFSMFPAICALADAITVEASAAEVRSMLPEVPSGRSRARVDVIRLHDQMSASVRPTLLMFQAAVGFVLLIACANVANLFLARASHRRRELGIKLALGASRWQAARESIVECVLLAIAGSGLGSVLTAVVLRFVRGAPPDILPRLSEIRLDAATFAFALTLSVLAGTAVAVFVSLRVVRRDAWKGMSDTAIDLRRTKPSPVLVVAELASAIVLVAGAALLLTSFVRLTNRDLGFHAGNALTMRLSLTPAKYRDESRQTAFAAQLVDALERIDGIEAAAAATELPFQPTRLDFYPIVIGGRAAEDGVLATSVVTPGYFHALGVPILRGREFSTADRPGAPLAAIVSQTFASRFFGAEDAVGQEIRVANAPAARVVGVAADTKRNPGITESSALPAVYFSAMQRAGAFSLILAFRAGQDPRSLLPAVRHAVGDLDRSLPIYSVATVARLLSERFAESRLYGMGAMALAGVALLLAAVGLYGVMAYSVASRTQEWGIRMALGADALEILRHVFAGGLRLTAIGIVMGVAGSWWTSRFLRTLLFGVTPNDPATLALVTTLFLAVALIACYIPARRASRVDPIVALRHE